MSDRSVFSEAVFLNACTGYLVLWQLIHSSLSLSIILANTLISAEIWLHHLDYNHTLLFDYWIGWWCLLPMSSVRTDRGSCIASKYPWRCDVCFSSPKMMRMVMMVMMMMTFMIVIIIVSIININVMILRWCEPFWSVLSLSNDDLISLLFVTKRWKSYTSID